MVNRRNFNIKIKDLFKRWHNNVRRNKSWKSFKVSLKQLPHEKKNDLKFNYKNKIQNQFLLLENGVPKQVMTYDNKGSFGELALLYNMPRAATVQVSP